MRVVWIATYPLDQIPQFKPFIDSCWKHSFHPSSWIVVGSKALAEFHDIDLHLIIPTPSINANRTVVLNGISFHLLKLDRRFRSAILFFRDIRRIRNLIKKIKPDIVHGHGTEDSFALSAVLSGFPHLISIQGLIQEVSQFEKENYRNYFVKFTERRALSLAKNIIPKSAYMKDLLKELYPKACYHEGQDPVADPFLRSKRSSPQRILFIGSLIKRKGIFDFMQIFERLSSKYPQIQWDVIGEGPALNICNERYFKPDSQLSFHGMLSSSQILEVLSEAYMTVLPSYIENTPNVLMESMAHGIPCVAYDVGGIKEMFAKTDSGLLVPRGNISEMTRAIELLINDQVLNMDMGMRAQCYARTFWNPKTHADNLCDIYRKILASVK